VHRVQRAIKFGLLLERASRLGFERSHRAPRPCRPRPRRRTPATRHRSEEGQSYVLSMLSASELERVVLPWGVDEARCGRVPGPWAAHADKPTARTCASSIPRGAGAGSCRAHGTAPAELVDASSGEVVGTVAAGELVTVGNDAASGGGRRSPTLCLTVDVRTRRITVGTSADALGARVGERAAGSACARARRSGLRPDERARIGGPLHLEGDAVVFDEPQPLVAPGQTVASTTPPTPTRVGAAVAATARQRHRPWHRRGQ